MITGYALNDHKIEKIWNAAYNDALACGLDDRKAERHANDKARAAVDEINRRALRAKHGLR
jgi:hypothetical protein